MRQRVRAKKQECTGCGACAAICPAKAIIMSPDEEGFLYPAVNASLCVGCDLCEKRCPAGIQREPVHPQVFGAQAKDKEIRHVSSSGGVFTALALEMLRRGGVVFGAAFDEALRVEHVGAFEKEELAGMRGSKYVQSDASDAIQNAASLLERGIPVLFSGTPCQIAGLLARMNGKHTQNLLTVDFVCHGVPSPGVFASYLKELEREKGCRITTYTFRDKRLGWKNFSAVARFEDGTEHTGTQTTDPFLYGFLQNLYLRPACHDCTTLRGSGHPADITLSDLWGAQQLCPQRDDDTGLSMVFCNTPQGQRAFDACTAQLKHFQLKDTDKLVRMNPSLVHPAVPHAKRSAFFACYQKRGFERVRVMKLLAGPGRAERIVHRAAHLPLGALRRLRALVKKKE